MEGPGDLSKLMGNSHKNNQTLTETRDLLLDHEGRNKNTYRVNSKKNNKGQSEVEL